MAKLSTIDQIMNTLLDYVPTKENAEEVLSLLRQVEFLAEGLRPAAPVQQGKVLQATFTKSFDLAVPAQRDEWFKTLQLAPRFAAKREGKLFVGQLTYSDGEIIAEIKSSDLSQATFFRSVVEAFATWQKKNGQTSLPQAAGRLPEGKIKDLALFGMSPEEIAAEIGRDISLVQEFMKKAGLIPA